MGSTNCACVISAGVLLLRSAVSRRCTVFRSPGKLTVVSSKMYYKVSGVTGKLTGATAASAYSPQGLKPAVPSQPPPMVFALPTKVVSEAGPTVNYMGINKVPELQKIFQKADGAPVHLKRGVMDKMLYRTTMGLTIGGTLYCLMALYIAAQPRKAQ